MSLEYRDSNEQGQLFEEHPNNALLENQPAVLEKRGPYLLTEQLEATTVIDDGCLRH